jgi:hypothetical protein
MCPRGRARWESERTRGRGWRGGEVDRGEEEGVVLERAGGGAAATEAGEERRRQARRGGIDQATWRVRLVGWEPTSKTRGSKPKLWAECFSKWAGFTRVIQD